MKMEISTFLISLYLINDLFNNYHNSHYRVLYSLQSIPQNMLQSLITKVSHVERTCSHIVFAGSLHSLFINSYRTKFLIFLKYRVLFAHLGKIQCNSNQSQMNILIKNM